MEISRRRLSITYLLMTLIVTTGAPAMAGDLISFKDDASVPHELLLNGASVGAGSIILASPPAEVVAESTIFAAVAEDLDAIHLMSNGHYLLSTTTGATIDGTFYLAGDIIEFDPVTGTATEFMDVGVFGSTAINIDALYLIESGPDNGSVILSTSGNATLDGLTFRHGDLVKYDKVADTAEIVFDQDEISGTISQKNIDALHITPTGDLIISVGISNGTLGGVTLESSDLIRHTPGGSTSVHLDGNGLFDGDTASLDAVGSLPAPVPALEPTGIAALVATLTLTVAWLLAWSRREHEGRAS